MRLLQGRSVRAMQACAKQLRARADRHSKTVKDFLKKKFLERDASLVSQSVSATRANKFRD
jgi:hypothetical protein